MALVGCLDDIRVNEQPLPRHIAAAASLPADHNLLTPSSAGVATPTLRRFTNVEFVCRAPLGRPGKISSSTTTSVPLYWKDVPELEIPMGNVVE